MEGAYGKLGSESARMSSQAETYRERAEEMRTLAESMTDSEARKIMIDIAEKWENMADRAEQMAKK